MLYNFFSIYIPKFILLKITKYQITYHYNNKSFYILYITYSEIYI